MTIASDVAAGHRIDVAGVTAGPIDTFYLEDCVSRILRGNCWISK